MTGPRPVEEPLTGGNVTTGLVRVGDTVRRPSGPQTPAVHALLEHLRAVGFRNAPRSLGLDDAGRHVVEHIPGVVAHPPRPGVGRLDPTAVGRMVRDLHDALDGWEPPGNAVWTCPIPTDGDDLVVHNDIAPWNIVIAQDRLVIIDWDGCSPGTRTWDLAYVAHSVVPLEPATAWHDASARLRALADSYRLDDDGRRRLAATLAPRCWSMHTLLRHGREHGVQPWSRLWDEGHGAVWRRDAEWAATHADRLEAALRD